jgi:hypothetical protein
MSSYLFIAISFYLNIVCNNIVCVNWAYMSALIMVKCLIENPVNQPCSELLKVVNCKAMQMDFFPHFHVLLVSIFVLVPYVP